MSLHPNAVVGILFVTMFVFVWFLLWTGIANIDVIVICMTSGLGFNIRRRIPRDVETGLAGAEYLITAGEENMSGWDLVKFKLARLLRLKKKKDTAAESVSTSVKSSKKSDGSKKSGGSKTSMGGTEGGATENATAANTDAGSKSSGDAKDAKGSEGDKKTGEEKSPTKKDAETVKKADDDKKKNDGN